MCFLSVPEAGYLLPCTALEAPCLWLVSVSAVIFPINILFTVVFRLRYHNISLASPRRCSKYVEDVSASILSVLFWCGVKVYAFQPVDLRESEERDTYLWSVVVFVHAVRCVMCMSDTASPGRQTWVYLSISVFTGGGEVMDVRV